MKTTMRDKVCQLIGKYQFFEEYFRNKAFLKASIGSGSVGFYSKPEESSQADMCGQFLADLNKLLEDDEAVEPKEDPRKTAPAGKWCTESAAQTAERVAKEARNNG
jgi:hypothetical protein